jgi:hypothetical protein
VASTEVVQPHDDLVVALVRETDLHAVL